MRAALWTKRRDHGFELIAPVRGLAPGETGEVAPGVIGAELAIGPAVIAHLMLPSMRVHPFEWRLRAACRPDPVRMRQMAAGDLSMRSSSPSRPSQPPLRGPASAWPTRDLALAEALDRHQLQLVRAPLGTGRDRRHECPPRRGDPLAAGAHPAEIGVARTRPASGVSPSRRGIDRHDLVLHRSQGSAA